jgi:hypothetical protein
MLENNDSGTFNSQDISPKERAHMEIYRVSARSGMSACREEYSAVAGRAQKKINIVCGEFDSTYYNSDSFVDAIINFIKKDGEDLSIIFNGNAKTIADATRKISFSNNRFLGALKTLEEQKTNISDIVNLYWCPIRPRRHYMVTDELSSVVEEDHDIGVPRDLYCFIEKIDTAKIWTDLFEKMKPYCTKVNINSLLEEYSNRYGLSHT